LPAPISQESAVAGADLNLRKFNEPYRRALQIRSDVREIRERFARQASSRRNRAKSYSSVEKRSMALPSEAGGSQQNQQGKGSFGEKRLH
jgi:hypothetical protein